MKRRDFLKASGFTAIFQIADCLYGIEKPTQKHNIVFILTDDQRFDAVEYFPGSIVKTPNINRLAKQGTILNNAFVVLSVCAPSRAACLTGRYGSNNGVVKLSGKMKKTEKTFAHYLKNAGYKTALIGKTHCSRSPEDLGFDEVIHFEANGPHLNRKVKEYGTKKVAKGYIEDYLARNGAAYIKKQRAKHQPYVLFYCTQVPHMNSKFDWDASVETLGQYNLSEMPVPESWNDSMEGKPNYLKSNRNRSRGQNYGYGKPEGIQKHYRKYYAAITDMDKALGKLVDEIAKDIENTYVIFMGDNGWFMGEHGFTSKVLPYEESIRVPMFAAGGNIKQQRSDAMVLNVDIAPTILQMAGIPIPGNMEGKGLLEMLEGKSDINRDSFFYEAPKSELGSWPLFAIRSRKYKYIRTYEKDQPDKMCFEELYDIENDPDELKNLVGLTQLSNMLDKMRKELDLRIFSQK